MEDSDYCMNEACMKKRQVNDAQIMNLQREVDELTKKLKHCQDKLKEREKKSLSHTDLKKTDKIIKLQTGIPTRAAFDALFSVVTKNVKKSGTGAYSFHSLLLALKSKSNSSYISQCLKSVVGVMHCVMRRFTYLVTC